jgi:hypothetical protein
LSSITSTVLATEACDGSPSIDQIGGVTAAATVAVRLKERSLPQNDQHFYKN